MKNALVFPGQGSQKIGMGKELAAAFSSARMVFEEVDNALNQSLSQLMFQGPFEELSLTENAQPAIMACSMATLRALEKEMGLRPAFFASYFAGHSLGEYSALCAARALTLADTARLLKVRGKAMQEAVPVGEGTMAALIGFDFKKVQEIIKAADVGYDCVIANDNSPEQVVISGARESVSKVIAAAEAAGIKRTFMLPVSAPFHCPLMKTAAITMHAALEKTQINTPTHPVVSNVTATGLTNIEEIRDRLEEQVCSMVRWRESVQYLAKQGVTTTIEIGMGNVLTGLIKRISPSITTHFVSTSKEMEELEKKVDWSVIAPAPAAAS